MINSDEKIERLSPKISVIVSPQHTFGTDAVLLADFAAPKNKDYACDLGTGCGIIPLLWCRGSAPARVAAVELQEKGWLQAKRSFEMNGLQGRAEVFNADLRSLRGVLPMGAFDLVTMNPPYQAVSTGIESAEQAHRLARHELTCTLEDAVNAAAGLLNFGGRFCLCQKPERLTDVLTAMRAAGLEPKRLRFVCQRQGDRPWLFLVEGKKGRKPGLVVMPPLALQDENGMPTQEIDKIYGEYREMRT